MPSGEHRCVFGPVPSRRLGRSLGVDLVPYKTCSYDCIYCQLGPTTRRTIERNLTPPLAAIQRELTEIRFDTVRPDYVTLSGSGEPTLHAGIGEVIALIRERTDTPVAVLTNGSLLWDPEVRRDLMRADLVIPSLDAGDSNHFQWVNRPDPRISFEQMVEGLVAFGREFPGQVWLEVFLVGGITAIEAEVRKIAAIAKRIAPDRIQLNTVARPPAESYATGVSLDMLDEWTALFDDPVEVIAAGTPADHAVYNPAEETRIIDLLKRRPCTVDDVSAGLAVHRNEAVKFLDSLVRDGKVRIRRVGSRTFYSVQHE